MSEPDDSKPPIDFTELRETARGEGLEALAERILRAIGLKTIRTGRGPDGGKDLIAFEELPSELQPIARTWLVQAKHFAKGGKAVRESDLGAVGDLCTKHNAHGYLLVTTTRPTKEVADLFQAISGGIL